MLVNLLGGDEVAPVYLLRLWAHCQNRKTSTFDGLPQEALKALCRFPGHANKLESALVASGFVRRDGQALIVAGFDEYNAGLLASRRNGQNGGRKRNPDSRRSRAGEYDDSETQPKPTGYPQETEGMPNGNPQATQPKPIREEERRLDKTEDAAASSARPRGAAAASARQAEMLCDEAPKPEKSRPALEAAMETLRRHNGSFSFEEILAATKAITAVIQGWPENERIAYAPSAAKFFNDDQWRRPANQWVSRRDARKTVNRPAQIDIGGRKPELFVFGKTGKDGHDE